MNVYDALRFMEFGVEPDEPTLFAPSCFPSGSMKQIVLLTFSDDTGYEATVYGADDYLVWRDGA